MYVPKNGRGFICVIYEDLRITHYVAKSQKGSISFVCQGVSPAQRVGVCLLGKLCTWEKQAKVAVLVQIRCLSPVVTMFLLA